MNGNIAALQQLLSTTDYITKVTPVMEDGRQVGYTIEFLHQSPITIYNGDKGDKGDKGTPVRTVRMGKMELTDRTVLTGKTDRHPRLAS